MLLILGLSGLTTRLICWESCKSSHSSHTERTYFVITTSFAISLLRQGPLLMALFNYASQRFGWPIQGKLLRVTWMCGLLGVRTQLRRAYCRATAKSIPQLITCNLWGHLWGIRPLVLHFLFICGANPLEAYSFVIVSGRTSSSSIFGLISMALSLRGTALNCLGLVTIFIQLFFFRVVCVVRNLHFGKWREIVRVSKRVNNVWAYRASCPQIRWLPLGCRSKMICRHFNLINVVAIEAANRLHTKKSLEL